MAVKNIAQKLFLAVIVCATIIATLPIAFVRATPIAIGISPTSGPTFVSYMQEPSFYMFYAEQVHLYLSHTTRIKYHTRSE